MDRLDVPQCGYCQSGQIMSASALLVDQPEAERRGHRLGDGRQHLPLRTYVRIRGAIHQAAETLSTGGRPPQG